MTIRHPHAVLVFLAFWITISAILICVYYPGLDGPFLLDDGENIALNPAVALTTLDPVSLFHALTANESGPLGRPLASLSFALNHYFAGGFDSAFPFKTTNLFIHAITAALIWVFVSLLLRESLLSRALTPARQQIVAWTTTAIWAVHPMQLTVVLYVVQRMTSLSALFTLLALIGYLYARRLLVSAPNLALTLMSLSVVGGTVAGSLCKETAVLTPLFALVMELTLFSRDKLGPQLRRKLFFYFSILAGLPVVVAGAYLLFDPEIVLASYEGRRFSLAERLLTEPRVLWMYLGLLLLPTPSRLSLFHDDILLSTGLLAPVTTLFALTAWVAVMAIALISAKRLPIIAFALFWFLVGHSLESSIFGLELAFEHRNYLPSLGPMFILAYAAVGASSRFSTKLVVPGVATAIVLALSFSTFTRAITWRDVETLAKSMAANQPDSPRAQDFAARVALGASGDYASAIAFTLAGLRAAPREAGFRLDLHLLLAKLGDELSRQKLPVHSQAVEISGLPREITVALLGQRLILSHPETDPDVVEDALRTQPLSAHVMVAMENLTQCVLSSLQSCARGRDDVLRWYQAAARNPRTSPVYKAIVHTNLAKIYADTGDYRRAHYHIDAAMRLDSTRLSYRLGKVEYLLRLGRVQEAKDLLDEAESRQDAWNRQLFLNQETIDRLRASIRLKNSPQ